MNNISIMGRLTATPELEYTTTNIPVTSFTVAVNRPRVKDTTDFIRCVAWRNTAKFISKYFSKGKMIAITGILTSRSWKDQEGRTHSINEVLVNEVDFCGDKASNNAPAATAAAPTTNEEDIPDAFQAADDDVPF